MAIPKKVLLITYSILFCLFLTNLPFANSAIALALGMVLSNLIGNPFRNETTNFKISPPSFSCFDGFFIKPK